MTNGTTPFGKICKRFYDRIEKDEKLFNYYNISISEAKSIAEQRAKNYLVESLDELSSIGSLDVDFSDYDEEIETVNSQLGNNLQSRDSFMRQYLENILIARNLKNAIKLREMLKN